jgi:large subunit ribosomal protein L18
MADKNKVKHEKAARRRRRVRSKVTGTTERPRLTVCKSLKNTYVQIIDDSKMQTVVGLGTNSKGFADMSAEKLSKIDMAKKIGEAVAELAKEKGVTEVVFDRNKMPYHGRVKAVADGARGKGLKF